MRSRSGGAPSSALLQLPVPDSLRSPARSNVSLAAGYLAAFAGAAGLPQPLLPPRELQDHGGDESLLSWLQARQPEVVGFSSYLWNIDRSRELARRLKSRLPDTLVVFGGPEIAAGSPLLDAGDAAASGVDALVLGEGEACWERILRRLHSGERPERLVLSEGMQRLDTLPDPYLQGILELRPGDSMFIETVRGCTRRCDYCYYSKAAPRIRPFAMERIPALFALARERGVSDIYIMDPCFNASADFRDKLRLMAQANPSRIPLHTELELEAVTPEVADLLQAAGFRSVEAGLQSVNRAALRAVHRGWRRDDFLRGAGELGRRGIAVRTGIILGLPRDTMEGFMRTIDFVRENGLGDGVEIYPLAVLPGTALRARSRELGLDYMPRPPYWVLGNGAMAEAEMVEALELAETALDLDFFPPVLPHFDAPGSPDSPITFSDLRGDGAAARLGSLLRGGSSCAVSLTLLLSGPEPHDAAAIQELGRIVMETSPSTLVQLVVESPTPPPHEPWERVASSFASRDHYFDRIHYYARDPQERFQVRLIHLTADPVTAERYYDGAGDEPSAFDLLVRFTPPLLGSSLLERHPTLLLEPRLPPREQAELERAYGGLESLLIPWGG